MSDVMLNVLFDDLTGDVTTRHWLAILRHPHNVEMDLKNRVRPMSINHPRSLSPQRLPAEVVA